MRLLLYFFIYAALNEVALIFLGRQGISNVFLTHYYIIIEFLFLSFIYSLILFNSIKKWIISATFVFLGFAVFQVFFTDTYSRFNNINTVLSGCILVGYSILYYDAQLQGKVERNRSIFWFNTAVFFYFSLSTLFFIFNQYFEATSQIGNLLVWGFHSVTNIGFNILIAYSLWRFRSKTVYFSLL